MKVLADKVEIQKEFDRYKALEFELFQGFFFAEPDILENPSLDSEQVLILNLINPLTQT